MNYGKKHNSKRASTKTMKPVMKKGYKSNTKRKRPSENMMKDYVVSGGTVRKKK
jgi:hypothetical protein